VRAWNAMRDWSKALLGCHCVVLMINVGGYDVTDLSLSSSASSSPSTSPSTSSSPPSSHHPSIPTRLQQDMRRMEKLCHKYWHQLTQIHVVILFTHLDVFLRKMDRSVSPVQLQQVLNLMRVDLPLTICQLIHDYTNTSSPITTSFPHYNEHQAFADYVSRPSSPEQLLPAGPSPLSSSSASSSSAGTSPQNGLPPRRPQPSSRFSFFRRDKNDSKAHPTMLKYPHLLPLTETFDPNALHPSIHASLQYIADQFQSLLPQSKKQNHVVFRALDLLDSHQVKSMWSEIHGTVHHLRHLDSFSSMTSDT